jgi:hypothetical protein
VGKGARFWGSLRFRESGVLGGNPSIPLDLASFGGPNRSYWMPMRPQSLVRIRGANREIGKVILKAWPAVRCSSRAPRPRLVWPVLPSVGFGSGELLGSCGFGLWCSWLVLGRIQGALLEFMKVSLSLPFVFWWWFLFQGIGVTEASWNVSVRLLLPPAWPAVSTGLTGENHQSDRCGTDSKSCRFPLCVWCVCFGWLSGLFLGSLVL